MEAPSPSPPKRRPLTRIALAISCTLLALTLITWIAGEFRMLTVSRTIDDILGPTSTPYAADSWIYRARSLRFTIFGGRVIFSQSEYQSYSHSREGAEQFGEHRPRGWSVDLVPRSSIWIPDHRLAYWESPTDFDFLGLGTSSTLRSGEESRIIAIPHWLLALTFTSLAFALWFPTHRRNHRLKRNQCPRCTYSRAGLAPSAPCPECGLAR